MSPTIHTFPSPPPERPLPPWTAEPIYIQRIVPAPRWAWYLAAALLAALAMIAAGCGDGSSRPWWLGSFLLGGSLLVVAWLSLEGRGQWKLRVDVLCALVEGEACGKEIRTRIHATGKPEPPIGRLYFVLDDLAERGLIESREDGILHPERGYRPRRYYRLTEAGKALRSGDEARRLARWRPRVLCRWLPVRDRGRVEAREARPVSARERAIQAFRDDAPPTEKVDHLLAAVREEQGQRPDCGVDEASGQPGQRVPFTSPDASFGDKGERSVRIKACPACGLFACSGPAACAEDGPASSYAPQVDCGAFAQAPESRELASAEWCSFGIALRALRHHHRLSMGQVAKRLGCPTPALSDVERGYVPAAQQAGAEKPAEDGRDVEIARLRMELAKAQASIDHLARGRDGAIEIARLCDKVTEVTAERETWKRESIEASTARDAWKQERQDFAGALGAARSALGSLERIRDRCPACGMSSLFIGNGGWLTCSCVGETGCKDPCVSRAIEKIKTERDEARAALEEARASSDAGAPMVQVRGINIHGQPYELDVTGVVGDQLCGEQEPRNGSGTWFMPAWKYELLPGAPSPLRDAVAAAIERAKGGRS